MWVGARVGFSGLPPQRGQGILQNPAQNQPPQNAPTMFDSSPVVFDPSKPEGPSEGPEPGPPPPPSKEDQAEKPKKR